MTNSYIKLEGGNLSKVYKNNDKVLRDTNYWSSTIHRLLLHLENEGCDYVPRYLGLDNNKEILSFVPGECKPDYPFTNNKEEQLAIITQIAKILRSYHDSTSSFKRNESDIWMLTYNGNLKEEVICHNDVAPYNVTFINGLPYGLIDFDTCCPGPRIWDIVYTLYRFIPLSESFYDMDKDTYVKYDSKLDKDFRKNSISEFFKAYGMARPSDLFEHMIARLKSLADLISDEANKGNGVFKTLLEDGHRDFYLKEIEFIKNHYKDWI